jgi:hypothetical protein
MAASDVEICNLAISWLAGSRITSLDDDESDEAKLCRANYDTSRRAVLEEREWTFAVKRVRLPQLAEPPLFGYDYRFLVPSDLLYSIGVYDPADANKVNPKQTGHVFEQGNILANTQTIDLKYIHDITNTKLFSPLFDQTVASHIAMNICIPLTENSKHFERMAKLYTFNLERATSSNGLQGTREMLQTSQMESVRRSNARPF